MKTRPAYDDEQSLYGMALYLAAVPQASVWDAALKFGRVARGNSVDSTARRLLTKFKKRESELRKTGGELYEHAMRLRARILEKSGKTSFGLLEQRLEKFLQDWNAAVDVFTELSDRLDGISRSFEIASRIGDATREDADLIKRLRPMADELLTAMLGLAEASQFFAAIMRAGSLSENEPFKKSAG